tara:strand:- start:1631 stop:2737 length:1107 start_codon:yes stop_codon:yes gene_type:complete
MKIELNNNKVFFKDENFHEEIHPFWLRERVENNELLDQKTQQRLFDPSTMEIDINIEAAAIENDLLNLTFSDGVETSININNIISEFINSNSISKVKQKIKWNSSLSNVKKFYYQENIYENIEMHKLLTSFYNYGFVIIKNVPTKDNYLIKFANSIGSVRRTNFGEYFNVISKPNPNDLAYTPLPLAPHTDNPYRNPVPCIQILHCIENEVSGGFSTLVDGYTVTEDLKRDFPKYYEILTKIKVKFKFIDKDVILEDCSKLIELDENKNFKQARFSPRLDFVPVLKKDELDLYYKARKKLSDLYNSDFYRIEFKLMPGDLLMMDNYRLLHGRTKFDPNEGKRFLQGCYIDYDSTDSKLRHLQRKFNIN